MRAHAELIKRWADDPTMEIEYCYELYEALQLIEQRLAIAVAALEWYAGTNNGNMDFARDTLTQIEEKK